MWGLEGRQASTPLHQAAYEGRGEVVRLLLGAGANVSSRNTDGRTPLAMSRLQNEPCHVEVAEMLAGAEQARSAAFAMGHHERLGAASLVLRLEPEVVRMVLDSAEKPCPQTPPHAPVTGGGFSPD